jgi:excisionase family DNA binding protein
MDSYRMSFPPELNTSRRHAAKTETAEPTIQADEILTVQEAADYLKLKPRAVYNLIAERKLRAKRINSRNYRILKSEAYRFMSH